MKDSGRQVALFKYDADTNRVVKRGSGGETLYVNPWYVAALGRNSKHIFAGSTRIITKLETFPTGEGYGTGAKNLREVFQYYYHPDHLGSTSYATDRTGEVYQHLEYFPFGETWSNEVTNDRRVPYRFTSKEFDEETKLYYFGARYYDPRTSVWQSPDPILGSYLDGSPSNGVYDSRNMSLYTYTFNNPINFTDPTGTCTNDPLCSGKWGSAIGSFSKIQDAEAVQDQFNFGKGTYNADPAAWNMDVSIDIGTQIQQSVKNPQGSMRNIYNQAKASAGKPVPFVWLNKAFNSDPFKAAKTKSWPFGRVSGDILGTMTVDKNGSYQVDAGLMLRSDTFSWKEDGSTWYANLGISVLGRNSG